MKNLLLIPLFAMLTSCGAVNEMCGSDLRMGCNAIFGEKPKDHRDEIEKLQKKDSEQDETISELQSILETLAERVDFAEEDISELDTLVTDHGIDLSGLKNRIDALQSRIVGLEGFRKIVQVINPCSYSKEILLKLDNSQILGYFETGNGNNKKAYLSLIEDGTYRTSDGTGCKFRVSGGTVTEL